MEPERLLKQYFGHSGFRPGQKELIDALMSGRDVLGVMPTGAGKSVCYQLPALMLPGMTLVVSPLISLMKDQVTALKEAGIPAVCLHSAMTEEERKSAYFQVKDGRCKLLYTAPERLEVPGFQKLLTGCTISLLAIDEAHCVSQWGQDFRPSYLKIAEFMDQLPHRPAVGAFTATATGPVKEDIVRLLGLQDPLRVTTGFDRPNLYFEVVTPSDKQAFLNTYLAQRPGQSGIVYCATRRAVESVCAALRENGFSAGMYHAGLPAEERRRAQEDFVYDRIPIMVATNAFGMGIDKSNVNFVAHYNMPKNPENYYQEAGRAGRDGEPATCTLLYSPADVRTARYLIENASDNEMLTTDEQEAVHREDLRRLQQMIAYCTTDRCLRRFLLHYFGEKAPRRCGGCGNCVGSAVQCDVTVDAQKVLSAAARIVRLHPGGLPEQDILALLLGEEDPAHPELSALPTFGAMKDEGRKRAEDCLALLSERGYLTEGADGGLIPSESAKEVLFRGKHLYQLKKRPLRMEGKKPALPAEVDDVLLERLKKLRQQVALRSGVPAYVVFSDATLLDMAGRKPATEAQFLQVSGVGSVKAARYGKDFLKEIAAWRAERSGH